MVLEKLPELKSLLDDLLLSFVVVDLLSVVEFFVVFEKLPELKSLLEDLLLVPVEELVLDDLLSVVELFVVFEKLPELKSLLDDLLLVPVEELVLDDLLLVVELPDETLPDLNPLLVDFDRLDEEDLFLASTVKDFPIESLKNSVATILNENINNNVIITRRSFFNCMHLQKYVGYIR